jgi:hypothetical protein
MKAKMLKLAGVKSEKEFYKKFPTEEAFMKVHGKAFKKAQIGSYIGGDRDPGYSPVGFRDVYDEYDYAITGETDQMRKDEQLRQAQIVDAQTPDGGGGGGGILGSLSGILQNKEVMKAFGSMAGAGGGAKDGKKIKRAQVGTMQPSQASTSATQSYYNWGTYPTGNFEAAPDMVTGNPGTIQLEEKPGGDFMKMLSKVPGPAGKVLGGIQQLMDERKAMKRAQTYQGVSDIVRQAAGTRPEETRRRYDRPENYIGTGEEQFPIYGVGTNYLAKNGASVGGGEIMNTFAPNTLYDDLGYEPMNESERYKQFYFGGKMQKAQTGLEAFAQAGGGDITGQLITGITGENAGGNLGGTFGEAIGNAIAPGVGGMIGKVAGQLIGTVADPMPRKTKKARIATQKNIQATAMQQGIQGIQGQYNAFMRDGGTTSPYEWVSNTWQPQVITTFGEHKLSDLLRSPKDADMLRAGGHLKAYTPPSERAMSTERPMMQEGGELQTHWGGYAEPMSYNPYLPEDGETIMFRGQSHEESDGKGNTGIGVTFGDSPVEVERNEPAMKMKDGSGSDSSLVVFGNLKVPKGMLPGADGLNFKKYVANLSKKENKINERMSKATTKLDELDVLTPMDQLALNTLQAEIDGGNQYLKQIAQNKMDAAALQTAMNDTIEEFGLEATDKGTLKARKGAMIPSAQGGVDLPKLNINDYEYLKSLYEAAKAEESKKGGGPATLKFQQEYHKLAKPFAEKIISKEPVTTYGKKKGFAATDVRSNEDAIFGKRTRQYMAALEQAKKETPVKDEKEITITAKKKPEEKPKQDLTITPYKRSKMVDVLNQVLPYLRGSDVEDLDAGQLAGEMYALATNQEQGVQSQLFQPQLSVPYDISLQDIMNENEASFRSQQRLLGYNPAFQSQLNAQKYAANQKVLGEQFRMNQAMKDQVYRENRNLLNQAKLQNLGILDQQYVRQAEAKSKTKATTQAALNSIASKYAQNKLENRTLQVYENMYNYRYDPRFRAMNMNPLWQPDIKTVPGVTQIPVRDASGKLLYYRQEVDGDATASTTTTPQTTTTDDLEITPIRSNMVEIDIPSGKRGKKVDKKKALNSSIVRSMKNL